MGNVTRINGKRPRQVAEPGAREHLRLDQRRHGEPARPVLELQATELYALVRFGVRPQRDAELPGPRGHVREIALDDIQVEQQGRGFDVVDVHASPFPFPLSRYFTTWNSVCRRRIQRIWPSAPSSASSSCADRTGWLSHSGSGVVAWSSIENQLLGSRLTSPRPGTPSWWSHRPMSGPAPWPRSDRKSTRLNSSH